MVVSMASEAETSGMMDEVSPSNVSGWDDTECNTHTTGCTPTLTISHGQTFKNSQLDSRALYYKGGHCVAHGIVTAACDCYQPHGFTTLPNCILCLVLLLTHPITHTERQLPPLLLTLSSCIWLLQSRHFHNHTLLLLTIVFSHINILIRTNINFRLGNR